MKHLTQSKLAILMGSCMMAASVSNVASATEFELGNGWKGSIGFQLQAFLLDISDNVGEGSTTRVQSGFDPSKLTVGVTAPEFNGVTVSGTFQAVQAISGAKEAGDSSFNNADGGQSQVRVAALNIAGDFGTFTLGRDIAIFGLQSLAHDSGSLPGVGRGSSNGPGGSAGRIDYGYYYADFHGGIKYASKNYGGLSFSLGLFDPIAVKDGSDPNANAPVTVVDATDPRFEADIKYNSKPFDVWASFIKSSTEGEEEQSGFDFGGEVRFGPTAITAAFSDGTGIKCCTPSTDDFQQWYVETDFTFGKAKVGGSFGQNELTSASGDLISEGDLKVLFLHYNLTPTLTLVAEVNNETVTNAAGVDITDRDTIAFGANWQF